mgnify:CR=1 FL=1
MQAGNAWRWPGKLRDEGFKFPSRLFCQTNTRVERQYYLRVLGEEVNIVYIILPFFFICILFFEQKRTSILHHQCPPSFLQVPCNFDQIKKVSIKLSHWKMDIFFSQTYSVGVGNTCLKSGRGGWELVLTFWMVTQNRLHTHEEARLCRRKKSDFLNAIDIS